MRRVAVYMQRYEVLFKIHNLVLSLKYGVILNLCLIYVLFFYKKSMLLLCIIGYSSALYMY